MARQVQTVLVSILLHVVALFLLVVIPLLAMDGLPDLHTLTHYVPVEIAKPEMPEAPRVPTATNTAVQPIAGPPIEAPTEIREEKPAQPPQLDIPTADGSTRVPGSGLSTGHADMDVAPPKPKEAPQEPVRAGGQVKAPTRVTYVPPAYPQTAVAARVSGMVLIEAVIGTDGVVRDARVLRSIPLLDEAALKAVKQWRYTPTTLNGIPVAVLMTVTVMFTLGGADLVGR